MASVGSINLFVSPFLFIFLRCKLDVNIFGVIFEEKYVGKQVEVPKHNHTTLPYHASTYHPAGKKPDCNTTCIGLMTTAKRNRGPK